MAPQPISDRHPRSLLLRLVAMAFTCLLAGGTRAADEARPAEYEVKAAFLFHFARLTDWPAAALPEGQAFVVAVVGRDPFGPALERVLENQTAHGRPLEVRRAVSVEELPRPAHIVFVGASDAPQVARVLGELEGRPVLTVSERDGFCESGGVVNFLVTGDGRVRFEVNVRAAEASGLKMSSQVLKLARIVGLPPR
jgi:hypothetical protein